MNGLKDKLDKLADMARQIDENWKEAEDTEYLIVIGNRNADDNIIWKFKKLSKNYHRFVVAQLLKPIPMRLES